MDFIANHSAKKFKTLGLLTGQTVIDYGCGPARYIRNASKSVGESGRVIAIDIHPLAIKKAKAKIIKYGLTNVETVLADGYNTFLPGGTADVVYALDMFHMIEYPNQLLNEFNRLIKPDGIVIIEDGHQKRSETLRKINEAGVLSIFEETKNHVKCRKK